MSSSPKSSTLSAASAAASPAIPASIPDNAPVVAMQGVTKRFGNGAVIDGLDLAVPRGVIFGMIGPSGCGKTTIIRMMLGVLAPTAGDVRVLNIAPARFTTAHRTSIGYSPQGFVLYPTLTVQENARFVAGLYGLGWLARRRRVREVLQFLELWDARRRLTRNISGGMQRRLGLACALMHNPSLLVVDEPTAGLDPVLRTKIWQHLRTLCEAGTTVVVTTQYIDEAVYCDTVAVLHRGRVAAVGTPDELRRRAIGGDTLELEGPAFSREDIGALWALRSVQAVERTAAGGVRLLVDDAATATPTVAQALQQRGTTVTAIAPRTPSFDEVFMKIVTDDRQPQPHP